MPKGVVPERDVECRACGTVFRSTRCGKAAFYCGGQACTEARRRVRRTVPNFANVERALRDAHAEALRMDRERTARLRVEERAAARREQDRERRRARARRQREAQARRVRVALASARSKLDAALEAARARQETVRRLAVELAALEARPAAGVHSSGAEAAEALRPRHVPTGDLAELMDRTQVDVIRRTLDASGERRHRLRRAVVDVANARGAGGMRVALHALAVEALAWEHQLRGGGRELGAAAKDAAA